jgi:hypothetical protein
VAAGGTEGERCGTYPPTECRQQVELEICDRLVLLEVEGRPRRGLSGSAQGFRIGAVSPLFKLQSRMHVTPYQIIAGASSIVDRTAPAMGCSTLCAWWGLMAVSDFPVHVLIY